MERITLSRMYYLELTKGFTIVEAIELEITPAIDLDSNSFRACLISRLKTNTFTSVRDFLRVIRTN